MKCTDFNIDTDTFQSWRETLQHMLGGKKRSQNFYFTKKGNDDYEMLLQMQSVGLVRSWLDPLSSGIGFYATKLGISIT